MATGGYGATSYGRTGKQSGGGTKGGRRGHGGSFATVGRQSGYVGMGNRQDPMAALEAWINAHDTPSGGGGGGGGYGGGGGGGGGGDPFAAMRSNAQARYGDQQRQLNDLYGDYSKLVKDNPAKTKAAYDALIKDTGAAGKAIAEVAQAAAAKNEQQREAGLTELGVSQAAIDASPSETATAVGKGATQLAQQNASWQGLQGVLSQARQAQDNLDIQGVADAKTLAHRQLSANYEKFMRDLDAQLAASYSGGGGGGGGRGGGSGSVTNKYRDKFEDAIFKQLLGNAGFGSGDDDGGYKRPRSTTTTTTKYDASGRKTGYSTTTKRG